MDFSQLPKMSNTPTPPKADRELDDADSAATQPATPPVAQTLRDVRSQHRETLDHQPYDLNFGGMWLSLISGIILLAMGQTFGRFLAARTGGRQFVTGVEWGPGGPKTGPVGYFELAGGTAWSDMGLFLMGVALLLDAVVLGILAARRRPGSELLWVTVVLTSIAMLINGYVIVHLFGLGIFPLASLIALAVGGFVVFDHMAVLQRRRTE